MIKITRKMRYVGGPTPSTARGKRRHGARTEGALKHAKLVYAGGYVVVPKKEKEQEKQ